MVGQNLTLLAGVAVLVWAILITDFSFKRFLPKVRGAGRPSHLQLYLLLIFGALVSGYLQTLSTPFISNIVAYENQDIVSFFALILGLIFAKKFNLI